MTSLTPDAFRFALDVAREAAQERLYEKARYGFDHDEEEHLREAAYHPLVRRLTRRGLSLVEAVRAVSILSRQESDPLALYDRLTPSQIRRRELEREAFEAVGKALGRAGVVRGPGSST